MFEEVLHGFEIIERGDELLEVIEPAGRVGRFVVPPHPGVARLIKHPLGQG